MTKTEHKSSVHPDVPNKPGVENWVEQEGGLPRYIERVAKHIMADSGYTTQRAIQAAISQTKKRAATGNAEAIAAIAQWEKMKASAQARPNKGGRRSMNLAIVAYSSGPSQQARATAQSEGHAFKSGRYPIRNLEDAKKAIHAYGRCKPEDKPALKRFIMRRLRALGHPELIPANWTSREMAVLYKQVIELAGTRDRGIYQKHKQHTEQRGKKKGDLKAKADWRHGYEPLSQTAFALKAKHVSKADLTSSGTPKPGHSREFNLPKPPHLTKSRTDEARDAQERSREPGDTASSAKRKPESDETQSSVAALRRARTKLERKVAAGTATPAEKKRLNEIVAQIKKRAKPVAANPARS